MNTVLRELAAKAASGDMDAAEALIRSVHGEVFSLLHLQGISQDAIDDVAQKVVLEMYASLPRYSSDRPFLPWLRAIARHVAANHRRSRGREMKRLYSFWAYLRQQAELRLNDPRPLSLDRDRLQICLQRLPDKHRELVHLRYFRSLSCEQIAEELGLKAAAVRQAMSRVRVALRECVESLRCPTDAGRAT